jgi:hypothetical protein
MSRRQIIFVLVLLFALSAMMWGGWRASDASLPPIARGIRGVKAGEQVFRERVGSRYRLGSSEADLVMDLERQGFRLTLDPQLSRATVSRIIICGQLEWIVTWKANRGRLTEVNGIFGATCV